MARNESDREDLIREATALRNRVEWQIPGEAEPVFAGIRSNGSLSVYFGPDPVYQFSTAGSLRRAYAGGFLYRTQGSTLARLKRNRSTETTTLLRNDLNADELEAFLATMDDRLMRLQQSIADGSALILRSVSQGEPPDYESLISAVVNSSPRLAVAIPTRQR
ncbi:MAG: hypothetical protein HQ518_29855 [Rhodopirellula sp.]|nr:hypothetical protein [Rhodopirellula sp.]